MVILEQFLFMHGEYIRGAQVPYNVKMSFNRVDVLLIFLIEMIIRHVQ